MARIKMEGQNTHQSSRQTVLRVQASIAYAPEEPAGRADRQTATNIIESETTLWRSAGVEIEYPELGWRPYSTVQPSAEVKETDRELYLWPRA